MRYHPKAMVDPLTQRIRERGRNNSFWQTIGLEAIAASEGAARLRLPVPDALRNGPRAAVHGGVLASVIDAAVASALATLLPEDTEAGTRTSTLDLNVSFLSAVTGGELTIEGRILRHGRSVAFGQADVFDEAGELVATGRATYRIRGSSGS